MLSCTITTQCFLAIAVTVLQCSQAEEATCAVEGCGISEGQHIGSERSQKDYYDRTQHVYDQAWDGRMHPGYFPHLTHESFSRLNTSQASDLMTQRMVQVAKINHSSKVLDMGCGMGHSCLVIADKTGADCVGLDLSSANIDKAKAVAGTNPKVSYVEGSFTDLPSEVTSQKFTHIFSQAAFVHVHKHLPVILDQARKVLLPGGVMIVSDLVGSDKETSASTIEHIYKRMHFTFLHGHKSWRHAAESAGYDILYYEMLDKHIKESFQQGAVKADALGLKSADGAMLADNYRGTVAAIEAKEIGLNFVMLAPAE